MQDGAVGPIAEVDMVEAHHRLLGGVEVEGGGVGLLHHLSGVCVCVGVSVWEGRNEGFGLCVCVCVGTFLGGAWMMVDRDRGLAKAV
jgi:hypothetical protein